MARDYESQWPAYVSVAERRLQGRTRGRQAEQEGLCPVAGDRGGPQDRVHVLGQGVVRQPGGLSRLRRTGWNADAATCATAW